METGTPFPAAINPAVNDRRGPEKSLGRLNAGVRGGRGWVGVQGQGEGGSKICSTNTEQQQCMYLFQCLVIVTNITTLVHYQTQRYQCFAAMGSRPDSLCGK